MRFLIKRPNFKRAFFLNKDMPCPTHSLSALFSKLELNKTAAVCSNGEGRFIIEDTFKSQKPTPR